MSITPRQVRVHTPRGMMILKAYGDGPNTLMVQAWLGNLHTQGMSREVLVKEWTRQGFRVALARTLADKIVERRHRMHAPRRAV